MPRWRERTEADVDMDEEAELRRIEGRVGQCQGVAAVTSRSDGVSEWACCGRERTAGREPIVLHERSSVNQQRRLKGGPSMELYA